jgi:hypothetical protein
MSFASDIEEAAGEPIYEVVIGAFGWSQIDSEPEDVYGDEDGIRAINKELRGLPIPWKDARPLLDYDYTTDFGAPDCHAIYAYSASKIIVISEYDGATSCVALPRHPSKCIPQMI